MHGRRERLSLTANENTARRNIYLPPELDKWFVDEYEKTDIKVNALMVKALADYAEKHSKTSRKKKSDFEKEVREIVLNVIKEKGLI